MCKASASDCLLLDTALCCLSDINLGRKQQLTLRLLQLQNNHHFALKHSVIKHFSIFWVLCLSYLCSTRLGILKTPVVQLRAIQPKQIEGGGKALKENFIYESIYLPRNPISVVLKIRSWVKGFFLQLMRACFFLVVVLILRKVIL